ncbi:TRIC cation channel family protein [Streptomyces sp. NBC_01589]|uniref:TRIC cation channel family protein n=1 Tax=unclassified Streptomyces TaxID=2593676 RepID=UPI00386B3E16
MANESEPAIRVSRRDIWTLPASSRAPCWAVRWPARPALTCSGFLVVGIISGLGGGLIKDVLLQHDTPVALTDYAYLLTAVVGSVVVFLIKISEESWNRLFTALDAAVIGFWAVAGANKTLAVGLGWLPAVLLGTLTAVGGGAPDHRLPGTGRHHPRRSHREQHPRRYRPQPHP